jgi:hypothetical protein
MDTRRALAIELMTGFVERRRRYLWTDAFAVCNFLDLDRATGRREYGEHALRLVEQVHRSLGRYRPDDSRRGPLSGLDDAEAEAHPTAGGLRIGKPLPERTSREPFDEQLEWERDGQYFHYLTKWMHALGRVALATRQPMFARWAIELAVVSHRAFVHGDPKRMYWKLSCDLSRPLVASMGQHDPLDGYVTGRELAAVARTVGLPEDPQLERACADFAAMIDAAHLVTADALGLGGLLVDASRLAAVADDARARSLVDAILSAAEHGLHRLVARADLERPARERLAFRELGLAIGLAELVRLGPRGRALAPFAALRDEIEAFWCAPANRATPVWLAHADIDDVMLATSLLR